MLRPRALGIAIGCALVVGCAGDEPRAAPLRQGLILFSPMYSAFGGEQTYSVTPYVSAATGVDGDAPLILQSVQWQVDERFVQRAPFDEIDGAILLTTKRVGVTQISLTAQLLSGESIRAETTLHISEADETDWEKGNARYGGDEVLQLVTDVNLIPNGSCGTAHDLRSIVREDAECGSCHNAAPSAFADVFTPTQTAGYSDEQLIAIFAHAEKPPGYTYASVFLHMLPQPDCGYALFHGNAIAEEDQRGLVLKLRSLPPHKVEKVDRLKLMESRRADAGP